MDTQQQTSFSALFSHAMQQVFAVFKVILLPILLLVVVKNIFVYLPILPTGKVAIIASQVLRFLLMVYIWLVSLLLTQAYFKHHSMTFSQASQQAAQQVLAVYFACAVYLVLATLFIMAGRLGYWGLLSLGAHKAAAALLSFLLLTAAPILLLFVMEILLIPLIVLHHYSLWQALKASPKLLGARRWPWGLVIYAIVVVMQFLMSHSTLHGHFLKGYYLTAPFDFMVLAVLLPLLNNLLVLLPEKLLTQQAPIRDKMP